MNRVDATMRPGPGWVQARSSDAPLELLGRIEPWPYIRTERRGNHEILRSGTRDLVIGTLDLDTGALVVDVPPGMAHAVREQRPLLETTEDGVRVDVVDLESRRAAESLLRWRIDLERFGPQLRNASP